MVKYDHQYFFREQIKVQFRNLRTWAGTHKHGRCPSAGWGEWSRRASSTRAFHRGRSVLVVCDCCPRVVSTVSDLGTVVCPRIFDQVTGILATGSSHGRDTPRNHSIPSCIRVSRGPSASRYVAWVWGAPGEGSYKRSLKVCSSAGMIFLRVEVVWQDGAAPYQQLRRFYQHGFRRCTCRPGF